MTKSKRRIMRRFKLEEISGVDVPAQEPALMTMFKAAPTRVVKGRKFFAVDFADVPNKRKPELWKMRLTDKPGGDPVKELVDKAIAAIATVKESRRAGVAAKLAKAWCKAYEADEDDEEFPEGLKALTQEEVDDEEGKTDPNEDEGKGPDLSGDMGQEEDEDGEDGEGKPKKPPFGAKPTNGEGDEEDDDDEEVVDKILKRYIDPAEGAKTFTEVLQCYEDDRRYSEAMEIAWPLVSALDTSLRSVVASKELDIAAKHAAMRSSVEMFLAKMRESMPDVEEELEKLFAEVAADEGDGTMKTAATAKAAGAGDNGDLQKQVTDLTANVEKLTKGLTDMTAERDAAIAKAATAEAVSKLDEVEREFYGKCATDDSKAAFLKADKAGRKALIKAALDAEETVTIAGIVVNKAAAGPLLPVILALQADNTNLKADLAKAKTTMADADYVKRAEEELAHLPGTVAEKVAYLKAVDALPEDARKTMKNFADAADKTATAAFSTIGVNRGETLQKAAGDNSAIAKGNDFMSKAKEIKKRDECTITEAMTKARQEHPDLYTEWRDAN